MVRYDPIRMAPVPDYGSSEEGDGSSPSKRKRPATSEHESPSSEHGSPSKRQRFESDVAPEGRKNMTIYHKPAFGEVIDPLPHAYPPLLPSSVYTSCWLHPNMILDDKRVLEEMEKYHRIRCQDALNQYRVTKGPDYELVELLNYTVFTILPWERFHYNFKAKRRDDSGGEGADDDGSPKLFYADLIEDDDCRRRLLAVIQCEIVDPSGPVGDCPHCEDGVIHPPVLDFDKTPIWMPVDLLPDENFPAINHADDIYRDRLLALT